MMHFARNAKHVYVDWSGTAAGYGVAWSDDQPRPHLMPSGVCIQPFAPELHPEPVIVPEHPWEQLYINAYATVFEDEGRFRLYYETYDTYESTDGGDYSARVCYAESTDGVHWTKPFLGLCEYNGSTQNNIVMQSGMGLCKGPHGAMVFRDPNGQEGDRYKMVYCAKTDEAPYLAGAVSPDGLAWSGLEQPVIPRQYADTQTVIVWDASRQIYVGYFRDWPAGDIQPGRRIVTHATTPDFYHWPERVTVFAADSQDDAGTDVYTSGYTPWPGAQNGHIMFPCFYPRTRDTMETHLAVSRDGLNWERPGREPLWGGYGAPGSYFRAGTMASQGIISPEPGQWQFFVGCHARTHNQTHYDDGLGGPSGLWRATIREDGLMALAAEARGECWTDALTFEGDRLRVNAWTHYGGAVRLGLCAEDGTPVPGYALDDCDPLTGDQLWPAVTWKGNADLAPFREQPVRLHLQLTRARLHAWRIGD